MYTVFAEVVVPRSIPDYNGSPTDGAWREVTCYVPPGGTVVLIRGYMKNEAEGSLQVPPKANTDHVGETSYRRCPLERGECDIGWSAGRLLPAKCNDNSGIAVSAKFANWASRNDRTAKLEVTYDISQTAVVYSEVVVPRTVPTPDGQPTESAWKEIDVHIPPKCTITSIKGYLKNEPQGGAHIPFKPDTDDMGSTEYVECLMDAGESPIKFAAGRLLPTVSTVEGGMIVKAKFANYFYRNDRWAKLAVMYLKEEAKPEKKKSQLCLLQ